MRDTPTAPVDTIDHDQPKIHSLRSVDRSTLGEWFEDPAVTALPSLYTLEDLFYAPRVGKVGVR